MYIKQGEGSRTTAFNARNLQNLRAGTESFFNH